MGTFCLSFHFMSLKKQKILERCKSNLIMWNYNAKVTLTFTSVQYRVYTKESCSFKS